MTMITVLDRERFAGLKMAYTTRHVRPESFATLLDGDLVPRSGDLVPSEGVRPSPSCPYSVPTSGTVTVGRRGATAR